MMQNIDTYASMTLMLIGVLTIIGGMLFRKTFAVVKNIFLAPIMGFFLALLPFSTANVHDAAIKLGSSLLRLASTGGPISALQASGLAEGLELGPETGIWLFIMAAALCALFTGASIGFSIRGTAWLKAYSMITSAFAVAFFITNLFDAFGYAISSITFLSAFCGLAVLFVIFHEHGFNLVLIGETSLIGSLLSIMPAYIKFRLSLGVYLMFTALSCAMFMIIGLMIKGRKNNGRAA